MTYMNFFEKIKMLLDAVINYKIVLISIVTLSILTILYFIKKMSIKGYVKGIILSVLSTLFISIAVNEKALADVFDNFANIFFKNIYFPNVYVYLSMSIIILVATITSFAKPVMKKSSIIINSITCTLNSILFIVILNIIAEYETDVFSASSLYTNSQLVAVLELSTLLFITWVSLHGITFSTEYILKVMNTKKVVVSEKAINVVPEIDVFQNMESEYSTDTNAYEEAELPRLKQPIEDDAQVQLPAFNFFNTSSTNNTYDNDIEVFSVDKYNLTFNEA